MTKRILGVAPYGARPEHWIAFLAGDAAGIVTWLVTRSVPIAVVVATVVFVGAYFVARRRR